MNIYIALATTENTICELSEIQISDSTTFIDIFNEYYKQYNYPLIKVTNFTRELDYPFNSEVRTYVHNSGSHVYFIIERTNE
jgi:hypothetical protein